MLVGTLTWTDQAGETTVFMDSVEGWQSEDPVDAQMLTALHPLSNYGPADGQPQNAALMDAAKRFKGIVRLNPEWMEKLNQSPPGRIY